MEMYSWVTSGSVLAPEERDLKEIRRINKNSTLHGLFKTDNGSFRIDCESKRKFKRLMRRYFRKALNNEIGNFVTFK